MAIKILGIAGGAGYGKDTAADMMRKFGYKRLSFAEPIRRALCAMLNSDTRYFTDRDLKEQVIPWLGKSPRDLAQLLGTEWGRELVHPDLWLNLALQAAEQAAVDGWEGVVFSDVRFPNEADFIRKHGMLIHIERNVKVLSEENAKHVSEEPLPKMPTDWILPNHGSLQELAINVAAVIKHHKGQYAGYK